MSAAWLARSLKACRERWASVITQWSFSLTTKMFLLVVLAVMPAIAIQSYNEYDLRKSREDDIRNKTIQITRQFGAEMGEIREGARQYLQVISQLPAINALQPDECARLLATLNTRTPYYSLLGVADAQGNVRCVSRKTSLSSVTEFEFFKRAMTQSDLAVGNYWVEPAGGMKQIHFALQFSDRDGGPPVGVVFAGLDLHWLSDHLKERGLTPTQSILIADRVGNIIARLPNPDLLVGKNMRSGHAAIMDGNTTGWEEARGVDGVDRIFGYLPPALAPKDFFLSAGESKVAAFASIDQVTRRGILLILVGLFLATYAAWLGGRVFIQRPIQVLLRATTEWRNGNYDARGEVKDHRSELGRLGVAFNEMAEAMAVRHAAQREAESRLHELNTTLEDRVEERTRELVAANRAKSQFLANMSHEIRTPMNGVIGMVELLLLSKLEPRQRMYVEMAQRSADMMLSLITSILDLSRIEAGKFELENKSFDLQQVLQDVTYMQGSLAEQKGLRLSLSLSTNVPTALAGDPVRLSQILNNLIGNAIKFTDKGDIVVSVALREATAGSVLIQFEVQDTGIGINEQDQAVIFNAFTQADGSDTRRFSGSGLGLSICKELCALMGGSIDVISQVGVGSTFRFSARFGLRPDSVRAVDPGPSYGIQKQSVKHLIEKPFLSDLTVPEQNEAAVADRHLGANAPTKPCALIVEDNAINVRVTAGMVESLGWEVEIAGNGLEALDAHARRHFDVILMDCQMPKMDGFEATAEIRKREAAGVERTQIIALTATADEQFRQRCLNAGMDEYISKPFMRQQILKVLTPVAG